jgi:hypothetical protein
MASDSEERYRQAAENALQQLDAVSRASRFSPKLRRKPDP